LEPVAAARPATERATASVHNSASRKSCRYSMELACCKASTTPRGASAPGRQVSWESYCSAWENDFGLQRLLAGRLVSIQVSFVAAIGS
jgi:hypothetical protein